MPVAGDLDGDGPLYAQIYRGIRRGVLIGRLAPGMRLASTRELAASLGVSRNTVLQAYERLLSEGYLEGLAGSGTYVAARVPDELLTVASAGADAQPPVARAMPPRVSMHARRALDHSPAFLRRSPAAIRIDFRYGVPNVDDFPADTWRSITARCLRRVDPASLGYGDVGGLPVLREAIVEHVRTHRGIQCSVADVIVVNGSQQALDIVARTLLDPGDRVLMENPAYPGARAVFQSIGARITHIGVDGGGLDVDRVRRLRHRVRLAYATPSHQFPTGATMPLPRRLAFLQWAHRTGAYVLEDDYDSEFRYVGRPVEAIAALDNLGQVIYSGTFSKILAPSLRLGYLIAPPALTPALLRIKSITDRHSPLLGQQVLAEFIRSGQFERHMRRARTRNDARRKALLAALSAAFGDAVVVQGENAGLHVAVWFPGLPASDTDSLVETAARAGIGVYSIAPTFHGPMPSAGLLLGYSSLDEFQITAGIHALARTLSSRGMGPDRRASLSRLV